MDWSTVRANANRIVHTTFAIPAVYTSPAGAVTPCNVRRHPERELVGDPESEGYARRNEDINVLVIDTTQIAAPERGATVAFTDDGSIYEIVNFLALEGAWQPVQVVRKNA